MSDNLVLFQNSCRLLSSWECSGKATQSHFPAYIEHSSDNPWYYWGMLTPAIVCDRSLFSGILCMAPENLYRPCKCLCAVVSGSAIRQIHHSCPDHHCAGLLQPALPHPFHALICCHQWDIIQGATLALEPLLRHLVFLLCKVPVSHVSLPNF